MKTKPKNIILFTLITINLILYAGFSKAKTSTPLEPWSGEYLQSYEGGLYVKIALSGFKSAILGDPVSNSINVYLKNLRTKKKYVINYNMENNLSKSINIWKIKAGHYSIATIAMNDKGKRRFLAKGFQTKIKVMPLCISNLGKWVIKPQSKKLLTLNIIMIKNPYQEADKTKSSLIAVINGFTGKWQEKFAGTNLYKKSHKDYGTDLELRSAFNQVQKIYVIYKLNLFSQNRYAKTFIKAVTHHEPALRTCYSNQLFYDKNLQGQIKFSLTTSKKDGSISKLKILKTKSSIKNSKLLQCVFYEVAQIQIPLKKRIAGELVILFYSKKS